MKIYTTNYKNTFIEMAEDCPVHKAEISPIKGSKKSVANLQFKYWTKIHTALLQMIFFFRSLPKGTT